MPARDASRCARIRADVVVGPAGSWARFRSAPRTSQPYPAARRRCPFSVGPSGRVRRADRSPLVSDLYCRLITPLNIEGVEGLKAQGIDLLDEHRAEFPPGYLRWIDEGYRMTALDVLRDQRMRTHVYDEIQQVLRTHDLLVTPTLGALPVDNTADGNTVGPRSIEGVEVDQLIGWCLTYLLNFTGHPAASIPAGNVDGLPVGMQLIGRRYGDADVFAASGAFERLRPWQDAYARCAARPLDRTQQRRQSRRHVRRAMQSH